MAQSLSDKPNTQHNYRDDKVVKETPTPLERADRAVPEDHERRAETASTFTDRDKLVFPGEHKTDPSGNNNPNRNPTPADQ